MEQPNIADLIASAVALEDQSVEQETYEREVIPAGKTIGRFIEYIELGHHKQKDFQGKAKPDAPMVRLTFELLHPKKNIREYGEEGSKEKHGMLISIMLAKKLNDKAKFKKLWNRMVYGRDSIKHMAQMLGEAFIIDIFHNVETKDGKPITYVNLDKDGEYGIGAPFIVDPISETKTDVPVPAATRPIKLFLWQNPTKATWDSLFIDGTHERKDASGKAEVVSKNWLQERILSATNVKGSMIEQLLGGVPDLPTSEPLLDDENDNPAAPPEDQPKAASVTADKAKATTAPKVAPKTSAADEALAALGLG
jgi:hypothetical protein